MCPGAGTAGHKGPRSTHLPTYTATIFDEFLTAGAESLFYSLEKGGDAQYRSLQRFEGIARRAHDKCLETGAAGEALKEAQRSLARLQVILQGIKVQKMQQGESMQRGFKQYDVHIQTLRGTYGDELEDGHPDCASCRYLEGIRLDNDLRLSFGIGEFVESISQRLAARA